MNILMMSNTYKPILGGLEKSVETFAKELRSRGHRVVIVAPEYNNQPAEKDVIRIPAVQNFNGSDFSVQLPVPGVLSDALSGFRPDVVHSHHPFLIGDTALRIASKYNVPLVFTHHTLYEENVHYVPGNQDALKRFVVELSTGYANLADKVIAPSESVMQLMQQRGVTTPIEVIPTGTYVADFKRGAGKTFRKKHKIPSNAFVVGHLGRLAAEKNLDFLMRAVSSYLSQTPDAHFLIAGKGPFKEEICQMFFRKGLTTRLHMVGAVKGKDLYAAYHAMNVFAFSSYSETQGLVLTEAMAAGIPVVALDAPGVRDVVRDQLNGRLLISPEIEPFREALNWIKGLSEDQKLLVKRHCRLTANRFDMSVSIKKILRLYSSLVVEGFVRRSSEAHHLNSTWRLIQTQWEITKNLTKAAGAMIGGKEDDYELANLTSQP